MTGGKYQIILAGLLILSLLISFFSVNQVSHYFSGKSLIGNWSTVEQVNSELDSSYLSTEESKLSLASGQNAPTLLNQEVKTSSLQGYLFDQYLLAKGSPLAGFGENFVRACAAYGAPKDCTLLIAISKVETNFCLTGISEKQHNCWGFGGSGSNRILYDNFPTAIDEVTRRLMEGYGARFFENPEWGGLTYCGGHCENWGRYVQQERVNINNYFKQQGQPALF